MKHIGIIGGLGPAATAYTYQRLVHHAQMNGAVNDQDFPPIDVITLETGVELDGSLSGEGFDELEAIVDEFWDHVILSSCNSITPFLRVINAGIELKDPGSRYDIVDMPALVRPLYRPGDRPIVACSQFSQDTELFYHPAAWYLDRNITDEIILSGMSGKTFQFPYGLEEALATANPFVIGCTEISMVLSGVHEDYRVIDSLELGCAEAVRRARLD